MTSPSRSQPSTYHWPLRCHYYSPLLQTITTRFVSSTIRFCRSPKKPTRLLRIINIYQQHRQNAKPRLHHSSAISSTYDQRNCYHCDSIASRNLHLWSNFIITYLPSNCNCVSDNASTDSLPPNCLGFFIYVLHNLYNFLDSLVTISVLICVTYAIDQIEEAILLVMPMVSSSIQVPLCITLIHKFSSLFMYSSSISSIESKSYSRLHHKMGYQKALDNGRQVFNELSDRGIGNAISEIQLYIERWFKDVIRNIRLHRDAVSFVNILPIRVLLWHYFGLSRFMDWLYEVPYLRMYLEIMLVNMHPKYALLA